jgi:hypothetical protein
MLTADPKTIARTFKVLGPVGHIRSQLTASLSAHAGTGRPTFDLAPTELWAYLRSTRGGAFVLMVARVADELAQAEVQDGATALDIARRVIAHQLAAGEADVQPGAASAVALLALQVNGQASLATLADLGELRDPPLTLGEP